MKRWRRPLLLIALLLLAGTVANVGVAWLTAHAARLQAGGPYSSSVAFTDHGFCIAHRWHRVLYDRVAVVGPVAPVELVDHSDFSAWPRTRLPGWAAPPRNSAIRTCTLTRAYGLPWRSLRAEAHLDGGVPAQHRGVLVLWDNRERRSGLLFERRGVVFLPTLVHPTGFAINTLFYAAILALPLSVFPIRRRLRACRGRCPKCGYDRAGLTGAAAACPECGADGC